MQAFRTNPPGQHFLGNEHTLAHFENAFYRSSIADNNSYEQWSEEGSLTAAQRANAQWKQMLADYEPPPIDPEIDQSMLDYIAARKSAMPDEIG
jgi:trimethylamine--corrinoid protein Co-methyltransferase